MLICNFEGIFFQKELEFLFSDVIYDLKVCFSPKRLEKICLLGTHLELNFECSANGATGSWMHCMCPC